LKLALFVLASPIAMLFGIPTPEIIAWQSLSRKTLTVTLCKSPIPKIYAWRRLNDKPTIATALVQQMQKTFV
jgi:hypothetical protein